MASYKGNHTVFCHCKLNKNISLNEAEKLFGTAHVYATRTNTLRKVATANTWKFEEHHIGASKKRKIPTLEEIATETWIKECARRHVEAAKTLGVKHALGPPDTGEK